MIHLTTLASAHEVADIERHKMLLEELFYLCLNKTFESTIESFREEIKDRLKDLDPKLALPNNSREKSLVYRNELMRGVNRDWYRARQADVANKHHYYHPSFTRDYSTIGSDAEVGSRFNILENIVFFNTPIGDEDTREHYGVRSGYMEIADDEIGGPYIRIAFDIGTTIHNMINIIEKQYPEISEQMQGQYRIPDIRRSEPDDRLMEKVRIFELHYEGETDAHIGVRVQKEGVALHEATAETINSLRRRAKPKIDRFNP